MANGKVVHNLGERSCMMRITNKCKVELETAFQAAEGVHKPLLGVSSIVTQGRQAVFALESPMYSAAQESRFP